jgi:uncharacterized protein (TIGR04222 family)
MKTQHTDDDLRQRIERFALSDPQAQVSFESKLALDNHWTLGYAQTVTTEYRRFLWLTQTAGAMVCPSHDVDMAWHLHLTQTRSYQRLCDEVLGSYLHHTQSTGGADELQKHRAMYEFTLTAYRKAFGQDAAPAIWPGIERRFGVLVRVPTASSWTGPEFVATAASKPVVSLIVLALISIALSVVVGTKGWGQLDGPSFLKAYLGLGAAMLAPYAAVYGWQAMRARTVPPLDDYEVAMLKGGAERVQGTAVARLVHAGYLELHPTRLKAKITGANCLRTTKPVDTESLHAVERLYLTTMPEEPGSVALSPARANAIADPIRQRLTGAGLLLPLDAISRSGAVALVLLSLLLVAGLSRLWFGISQHHPVTYLVPLLVLVAWALMAQVNTIGGPTALGRKTLKDLAQSHPGLKSYAPEQPTAAGAPSSAPLLALAFALFGSQSVMANEEFAGINFLFPKGSLNNTGNSGGAGGCGGGGGGCGGGCGGCGG